jgi:porin
VPTAATWGDFDLGVTQAYVRQSLFDNSFQYAVGRVFAPNFVNAYPFFDDNRQLLNQNFSTSPTIASVLRGVGAVALWFPTQSGVYVQEGVYTANSQDTGHTVDSFFNDQEYFSHVDIGWSALARRGVPIQGRGPMDPANVHVTFWHKDAQANASNPLNAPETEGIAFNVNMPIGDSGMWFLRGGQHDGWVTERALSGGVGLRPEGTSDLWGVAVGWTEPAAFVSWRDQTVIEAFYRYQLTPNFAITPDIQLIRNPSINPAVDKQIVLSLRGRITF